MLVDRVKALKLGDGRKAGTDVGPLIHEARCERSRSTSTLASQEERTLVCGREPLTRAVSDGNFFEPTIFARVEAGQRLEQEEIFGPVLSVIRVPTLTRHSREQ